MNIHEQDAALGQRVRQAKLNFPYGLLTPGTVFKHARRATTRRRLIDALRKCTFDDIDHLRIDTMEAGLNRFGDDWDYVDNICVSHAFAELAQPRNVLEIGVRLGMCTSAIAAGAPEAGFDCVDMWAGVYSGRANPGPEPARQNLKTVGHRGVVEFHQGNSHAVLPALAAAKPQLQYDLILVDGDHSTAGATQDLRDTFPRLAPGGMLVFDDIGNAGCPGLLPLWRNVVTGLGWQIRHAMYLDHAHGVGIALRSTFNIAPSAR